VAHWAPNRAWRHIRDNIFLFFHMTEGRVSLCCQLLHQGFPRSLQTHPTMQMLQVCQYQQAVICLEESSTRKYNMSSPNPAPFCRQSSDSLTSLQACLYQQAASQEALPHTLRRLLLPEPAPFKPRILRNRQQIAGV